MSLLQQVRRDWYWLQDDALQTLLYPPRVCPHPRTLLPLGAPSEVPSLWQLVDIRTCWRTPEAQ